MHLRASPQDIDIFRSWLAKQAHLPQDVEDHYISSFIVGCKGSLEKAKSVFDNYYKVQQTKPELFHGWDPFEEEVEKFNMLTCVVDLPKQTPENYNVCVGRLLSTDPTYYNNTDMFVRYFVLIQIHLWENRLGSGEYIFIIDAQGATLSHLKDINPVMVKMIIECLTLANPIRIKAMHLVNLPPIGEWAVNMFKQFMPQKLKSRLFAHSDYESLKKMVPKEILPEEMGGDEVSLVKLYAQYRERVAGFRERMKSQKKLREEELPKRPKKPLFQEEMSGTFRKLNLD